MAPKMKTLPLISLILGLGSIGALALAVATDYWLFSVEPITTDMLLNMLPNEGGDAGGDQVKVSTAIHAVTSRFCGFKDRAKEDKSQKRPDVVLLNGQTF